MVARELGKWPVDGTNQIDLIMPPFVDSHRVIVEAVVDRDAALNEFVLGKPRLEQTIVNGALAASAAVKVGSRGLAKLPVHGALDGELLGHAGVLRALI